jgi:hypothetical protein
MSSKGKKIETQERMSLSHDIKQTLAFLEGQCNQNPWNGHVIIYHPQG